MSSRIKINLRTKKTAIHRRSRSDMQQITAVCSLAQIRHAKYVNIEKMRNQKEVHFACLEKREVMLADDEEIEQAKEEGLQVHPGQTFEAICGGIRS